MCYFADSSLDSEPKSAITRTGRVFNHEAKEASNERRLQAFFKECELDEDQVAFVLSLFLVFGKVDLCLDRTEWDFGKCQVNLLVLSAYCQGVGLPLYVEYLDNSSGNSATADRISVLKNNCPVR